MFQQMLQKANSPENIQKQVSYYTDVIFPFYTSQGVSRTLQAKNAKISCRIFINQNAKAKIIFVAGYNETYLKYAETLYDLFQQGYSIFTYDHRGQGFSEKFPNQNGRGYVDSFDDLVNDLAIYFNYTDNYEEKKKIFILANSMGGMITILATSQKKINPARIVLTVPMMGIVMGSYPILEYPIYLLASLMCKLGYERSYAFGERDCFPLIEFEKNETTHSEARYQIWQKNIREIPDIQLGGPTFKWLREAIKSSRIARKLGRNINIPILIIQAENDIVVCNSDQNTFLKNCSSAKLKVIPHAKHAILIEIDYIREQVLKEIDDFFMQKS